MWIRVVNVLLSIGFVGSLSMADRAPRRVRAVMNDHDVTAAFLASDFPLSLDAMSHTLMWGGLAFVVAFSLHRLDFRSVLGLTTMAGLSEPLQRLLTGSRNAAVDDVIANLAGVALGLTVAVLVAGVGRLRQPGGAQVRVRAVSESGTDDLLVG